MIFLKKLLLGIGALFLILVGGAGTQSNSTLLQGGGFFGLIIGLVVLYVFAKMAWRAMGCLPSILVILAIILFIMYAIGSFKGGINNVIPNLKNFIGYSEHKDTSSESYPTISILDEEEFDIQINENFSPTDSGDNINEQKQTKDNNSKNIIEQIFGTGSTNDTMINPRNFPVIYSRVKVSSADTLVINGHYFRLYGIDAPENNQTCSDYYKRPYHCGKEASSWLRSWLQDNEVECRIMQQDNKGNMVGVCFLGEYDIAAALVNAGWAVVYSRHTDIYMPYQIQARKNANGLWQGEFYMPWDWRKIQSRKPQIKIINKKPKRKRTFFNPLG